MITPIYTGVIFIYPLHYKNKKKKKIMPPVRSIGVNEVHLHEKNFPLYICLYCWHSLYFISNCRHSLYFISKCKCSWEDNHAKKHRLDNAHWSPLADPTRSTAPKSWCRCVKCSGPDSLLAQAHFPPFTQKRKKAALSHTHRPRTQLLSNGSHPITRLDSSPAPHVCPLILHVRTQHDSNSHFRILTRLATNKQMR